MTILVWPHDSIPEMRSFRLKPFNIASVAAQTQELIPGGLLLQRWEARLTLTQVEEEQWRDLSGLASDLAGTGGLIRLWDHARAEPYFNRVATTTSETWDGGPTFEDGAGFESGLLSPYLTLVNGASRGANYLVMAGFPASTEGVLRRGDLFEIRPNGIPADHGHLYEVTRTARSNADGQAGVYFKGGLRKGVHAGDMAVVGGGPWKPSSVFRLASDDEGNIEVQGPMIGSLGLSFIEVLPHA
jgi:hypothetical protein